MFCRNCGTPYSGGVVCEKCGTRYTDEELNEYNAINNKAKSGKSPVVIILIIVGVITGFLILGIIAAIFIPAYVGYKAKVKEAQEMEALREKAGSSYYEEQISYD